MRASRRKSRKIRSFVWWCIAWLATALVLFALADMVGSILIKGVTSFHFSILTTLPKQFGGGLRNAILGTFELVVISVIFSVPLGILGGVFVSEYANHRLASFIRFLTEVLSGVPSIIIGYFGYLLMVLHWGWGFSPLAAGISLTIIMLPYILRTTDSSLTQVSLAQREGAWALGMTRFQAISRVVWRPATNGILTGVLLAVAISMGETAPLLYTAGWTTLDPTLALTHQPIGYLTYVIWTYIDMPYASSHALAYSAAFLLVLVVLLIQIVLRLWVNRKAFSRS